MTRMDPETLRHAKDLISRSHNVLVLTHQRPDGDALGSMLGLTHMLRASGKQAFPVLAEGISSVFRYLPGTNEIRAALPDAYDLSILVDCADKDRIGYPEDSTAPSAAPVSPASPASPASRVQARGQTQGQARGQARELAPTRPIDLIIDHHITNGRFAAINLVDPASASTAEFIVDLSEGLGLTIPRDAAACLMAGVVTDTLGFRTPNTGIHTLDVVRTLICAGASLPETVDRSLYRRSFTAARYWGAGLSRLERDGEIVWTWLTLADRTAAGYPGRDDADLVNILSSIDGPEVAVIFVEQEKGKIKISWRAVAGLDVTPLAGSFGGGGHPAASGAVLAGGINEVMENVLRRTRQWLAEAHAAKNPGDQ
jgi:phosphoesterase RecJ-like protein